MLERQKIRNSENLKNWMHSSELSNRLGISEIGISSWDVKRNEYLQASSNNDFDKVVDELKLDAIGYQYLKPKAEILDPTIDKFNAEHKRVVGSVVDTIITAITPTGYDEIIVTTNKPLSRKNLKVVSHFMPQFMQKIKKTVSGYDIQSIRKFDQVLQMHKEQLSKPEKFKNLSDKLNFGDVTLSNKEIYYLRGVLLHYSVIDFEKNGISQRCASHIKQRLLSRYNLNTLPELISFMSKYGVMQYICNHLI